MRAFNCVVPEARAQWTQQEFFRPLRRRGATLRVFLLPIVKEKFGVPSVLGIVSAVSLLGLVVTFALRREDIDSPLFGIVEMDGK
jgi:hypothetical protein